MSRTRELDFELTVSGQAFPVTAQYYLDPERHPDGGMRFGIECLAFKVYYPHDLEFDPPKVLFTDKDAPVSFPALIEAHLSQHHYEQHHEKHL